MKKSIYLGELQFAIMTELWRLGEGSVSEVHAALTKRQLAPTTIATMLKKMEARGVIAHRVEGRRFIYRPLVSHEQVTRSMVSQLTSRLFGGDATALMAHLISQ